MDKSIIDGFAKLGIHIPEILIPKSKDLSAWSVVACDQYTSQPQYWDDVKNIVGSRPSTFRLMLPEVFLEEKPLAA